MNGQGSNLIASTFPEAAECAAAPRLRLLQQASVDTAALELPRRLSDGPRHALPNGACAQRGKLAGLDGVGLLGVPQSNPRL
jgi:hypothetical protein